MHVSKDSPNRTRSGPALETQAVHSVPDVLSERAARFAPLVGDMRIRIAGLPPLVHRNRLAIVCAEDAPVAVGLTANNYHLNLIALEHVHQLVSRRRKH